MRSGRSRLSYVAGDVDLVRESVRNLVPRSARRVFSGHGRPFSVDDLRRRSN